MQNWKVIPLAQDHTTLCESPDPANIYCYTPGLAILKAGEAELTNDRIVATMEFGGPGSGDMAPLPGSEVAGPRDWRGRVFTSDDHGKTWTHRANFPISHARPFTAGNRVYIIGQAQDLVVIASDDGGETWCEPVKLTENQKWHQSACNVHYANECVYLVMERRVTSDICGWSVGEMAPVLMRGKVADDLMKRENWTFASELSFREVIPGYETDEQMDFFGVPFYPNHFPKMYEPAEGRGCAPMGWLETNITQIVDPDHYWYDPTGHTFHLIARAHTGGTGYAAYAKVVENDDGTMTTMLETVPSGKQALFLPCPGGQMRFHVLYDEKTRLYWLLSTQATDSMTRANRLPENRYNLPNNERRRLQLHFSKNLVDWCFAGLVAVGAVEHASRHYASMVIDGESLHVLSRSGDERAANAHNGNLITFHTVKNFRNLVY
jgi:hypothetical protein